ncbi:MAG TPA: RNA methyltransferase [Pseudonocardia sp.]|jgi:tRNA G18 (ribose-2'-O)-methylase SpoU
MAGTIVVDDPEDPRVDDFRDLTAADRRPDRPGGRGLVIAEGVVVVRRLLASPYPVRALLGVPARLDDLAEDLAGVPAPAYRTSPEVMSEVVGFHLNRGVLAVADRAAPVDPLALAADPSARVLAVLEGVNDHENLGSVFRNAAALGAAGVLLGPRCADPLYRRSVRVSMGHVLRVPFATLPAEPPWPSALDTLRAGGRRVVALTPRRGARPLPEAGLGDGPVALLLGAEGPGLSEPALDAADGWARIPMADGVDSLNVATAAAVAFYAAGGRAR